jgi:hypothetical protein
MPGRAGLVSANLVAPAWDVGAATFFALVKPNKVARSTTSINDREDKAMRCTRDVAIDA